MIELKESQGWESGELEGLRRKLQYNRGGGLSKAHATKQAGILNE